MSQEKKAWRAELVPPCWWGFCGLSQQEWAWIWTGPGLKHISSSNREMHLQARNSVHYKIWVQKSNRLLWLQCMANRRSSNEGGLRPPLTALPSLMLWHQRRHQNARWQPKPNVLPALLGTCELVYEQVKEQPEWQWGSAVATAAHMPRSMSTERLWSCACDNDSGTVLVK